MAASSPGGGAAAAHEDAAGPAATVRSLIDAKAKVSGDAPFLVSPESGSTLSYRELRDACRALAGRLGGLGLGAGDKVAFLMDNGPATATIFLGSMYAGLVVVPINAVAGRGPMTHALDHCDARVLFLSESHRGLAEPILEGLDRVIEVIATDEEGGPHWGTVEKGSFAPGGPPSSSDDAVLLYTSGTTGVPKGAVLSHRAVIRGGLNTSLAHELGADDRALCVLPLYHINAEMVTVMGPLTSGGSVVMPRRFSAGRFWSWVEHHRCTWLSVVPTIIKYLLDRRASEPYRFPGDPRLASLRFGRSASAPLPASVHAEFEALFGLPMIETMGLTETAAPMLSNPMPPARRKPGSPGIAFGNEVKVVGEGGATLPAGRTGELLVRGDNVLTRYYKNPQATSDSFSDGWFRTGDLGYRDEDGYYFITGRLKELIIKGGENIAPREIDDVLYRHPAVLEAAAVGVADEAYGQEVVACVRLRDDFDCDEAALVELCREELGPFKAPRRIYFMDDLPKGPSGKIQRLRLPELIGALTPPP